MVIRSNCDESDKRVRIPYMDEWQFRDRQEAVARLPYLAIEHGESLDRIEFRTSGRCSITMRHRRILLHD